MQVVENYGILNKQYIWLFCEMSQRGYNIRII